MGNVTGIVRRILCGAGLCRRTCIAISSARTFCGCGTYPNINRYSIKLGFTEVVDPSELRTSVNIEPVGIKTSLEAAIEDAAKEDRVITDGMEYVQSDRKYCGTQFGILTLDRAHKPLKGGAAKGDRALQRRG